MCIVQQNIRKKRRLDKVLLSLPIVLTYTHCPLLKFSNMTVIVAIIPFPTTFFSTKKQKHIREEGTIQLTYNDLSRFNFGSLKHRFTIRATTVGI